MDGEKWAEWSAILGPGAFVWSREKKEGGRRNGEGKKVRKGEQVEGKKGARGRAGVSEKQGVKDRSMKEGNEEG